MKSFALKHALALLVALIALLAGGAFAFAHSQNGNGYGHDDHGHNNGHHGKGHGKDDHGTPNPPAPEALSTWGKMPRNEFGSPIAETASTATGVDALILETGCYKEPCTEASSWEKAEYGSEVEFGGLKIADIDEIGLSVYIADSTAGHSPMPNIQMEVNPKVAGKTYSSLAYNPGETTPNVFESVDATAVPSNPASEGWWFSNATVATTTGCTLASACSLAELQAAAPEAEVSFSLGLGKGRDTMGEILIDEFKLNGTRYTFGPEGTFKE